MIRTQVYLPDDLYRNLKLLSATCGMNFSELIREGAKIVVERKTKKKIKFDAWKDFIGKGLKGDPSDNIFGIKGIGEKTAGQLIQKFGSLENIYEKIKEDEIGLLSSKIKARTIQLLKENEKDAFFSKALTEIRRDAPISFSLSSNQLGKLYNPEKVRFLFEKLGFKSFLARLPDIFSMDSGRSR